MNNEQAMQLLADNGLHEGGMDNWVLDNAWVKFANLIAAHEREACAKLCDDEADDATEGEWDTCCRSMAKKIRARGTT